MDKLKVLWFAKDAPMLTSAYGKIAHELVLRRLAKVYGKENISLFATVGYEYTVLNLEDVTCYPKASDPMGEDIFLAHYQDFKANIYVTACDIWPLNKVAEAAQKGQIMWCPWAFIDFDPIPQDIIERLKAAFVVVPTSRWLEGKLRDAQLPNVLPPAFLGVNQKVYRPFIGETDETGKEVTKERLKAAFGIKEGSFLISICEMNQTWRKAWDEQLEGIRIFQENNPDIYVSVYLHTQPNVSGGYNMPIMVQSYNLNVKFADTYTMIKGLEGYNEEHMSKIFNTSDVVLNATNAESPGMPPIEAQSSGCPVVTTNYTAMPEFTEAGYTVKVLRLTRTPSGFAKAQPDPYDIADKLEKIANSDPAYWRKKGPEAMSKYSWERTLHEWLLTLEEVQAKMDERCLKVPEKTLTTLSRLIEVVETQ